MSWYIKTYKTRKGIEEKVKYWVSDEGMNQKRDRKRAARREARRADGAEHILARALNQNFDEGEDLHLVLELDEKGMAKVEKRAEGYENEEKEDRILRALGQETQNFIRRLQRVEKGLKYIFVPSDLSKDRKTDRMKAARPHVHLIIRGCTLVNAREKWGLGEILVKELYNVKGDFHALAEYLLQQTRRVEGTKRYTPSRNLDKPEETEPVRVRIGGESMMRCPKGCVELYHSPYERGRNQYMRYLRPADGGTVKTVPYRRAGKDDRGDGHGR